MAEAQQPQVVHVSEVGFRGNAEHTIELSGDGEPLVDTVRVEEVDGETVYRHTYPDGAEVTVYESRLPVTPEP